jgi:hypothetical protein
MKRWRGNERGPESIPLFSHLQLQGGLADEKNSFEKNSFGYRGVREVSSDEELTIPLPTS